MPRPLVRVVTPSLGTSVGGVTLRLAGTGLAGSSTLACGTGTVGPVAARLADAATVECVSPAHAPGPVPVGASLDRTQSAARTSAGAAQFTYVTPLPAAAAVLLPAIGPAASGWMAEVHGVGEWLSPARAGLLSCAFGSAGVSPALAVGSPAALLRVACAVPAAAAGFVAVQLSVGSADAGTSQLQLLPTPRLRAALPRTLPVGGGGVLHLLGAAMPAASTVCALGGSFSSASSTRYVSSALLLCESPPVSPGTSMAAAAVLLSGGGSASAAAAAMDSAAAAEVLLVPAVVATAATPWRGPESGGTPVRVEAHQLLPVSDHACAFGAVGPVAALWAGAAELGCVAPAHAPGAATLRAAAAWPPAGAAGALEFLFVRDLLPQVVLPAGSASAGGAAALVFGDNLALPGLSVALDASGAASAAQWVVAPGVPAAAGGVGLAFRMPPHQPGFVALQLVDGSAGGVALAAVGDGLQLLLVPRVAAVLPRAGPFGGGTVLTVTSAGALGGTTSARVGDAPAAAAAASSALVRLELPPAAAAGPAPAAAVELCATAEADACSESLLELAWQPLPSLLAVQPQSAALGGGAPLVRVAALGLVDSAALRCRFGTVDTAAHGLLTATLAACVPPAHAPGPTDVRVSNNQRDLSEYTPAQSQPGGSPVDPLFAFTASPLLAAAVPPSGPASGGTLVWVLGVALPQPAAVCWFGASASGAAAGPVSAPAAAAACAAPPHAPGFVALDVAPADGGDRTESGLSFLYSPLAEVSLVLPPASLAGGGSVLTVLGLDLLGERSQWVTFGVEAAPARFVSSVLLTVEAPPAPVALMAAGARSVTVAVEYAGNGVDWERTAASHRYEAPVALTAAAPATGSQRGGTAVTFTGSSFSLGEPVWCRFGTIGPLAAEVVSPAVVRCNSPAHDGAVVPVALFVGNMLDAADGEVFFEY